MRRIRDAAASNMLEKNSGQEATVIKETIKEAETRMKGAIQSLEEDLGGIRTGRASPALVERLQVSKDLRESLPPTIHNFVIHSHPKSSSLHIELRSAKENKSRLGRIKKSKRRSPEEDRRSTVSRVAQEHRDINLRRPRGPVQMPVFLSHAARPAQRRTEPVGHVPGLMDRQWKHCAQPLDSCIVRPYPRKPTRMRKKDLTAKRLCSMSRGKRRNNVIR